jgi:hypothetical protein
MNQHKRAQKGTGMAQKWHNNYEVSNLDKKMSTELAQKSTERHKQAQKSANMHRYKEHLSSNM